MAARARGGDDVAVWIYTLQLTPEDVADPGDQLKAVLAFRERLYKEALIKEFRNVDDFAAQLYRDPRLACARRRRAATAAQRERGGA